jgi:lactoylglutathione lyase
MIRFTYTIFYVKDVTKSIIFYEKAFGFARKFIAETNEYGELLTGETTLAFASLELAKKNLPLGFIESTIGFKPFGMEVGFTTDDVNRTMQDAIKAGAVEVAPAMVKPWGQTVAYVRDPDGFLIEICTPMN